MAFADGAGNGGGPAGIKRHMRHDLRNLLTLYTIDEGAGDMLLQLLRSMCGDQRGYGNQTAVALR